MKGRRIAFIVFLVVGVALILFNNGIVFHWLVDALLFVVVSFVYPYFVNRHQMISLFETHRTANTPDTHAIAVGPVRVLSFNLFMRPGLWFIKNNLDGDYKDIRLKAFLSHLDGYGIIALQEMFGLLSFRQRKLLKAAAEKGYCHAAVTGAPPYLFFDRHWNFKIPFLDAGVVILSRFPIVETDSHYYMLGNQIDGWAPKQV
jgi:hypothetical protein